MSGTETASQSAPLGERFTKMESISAFIPAVPPASICCCLTARTIPGRRVLSGFFPKRAAPIITGMSLSRAYEPDNSTGIGYMDLSTLPQG